MLRLVSSRPKRGTKKAPSLLRRIASALRAGFLTAFPMPPSPEPPPGAPPLAKAAALHEGAFLRENVQIRRDVA
ncbi:MAG TPA: hypothetical protein VG387_05740 [Rhizomicrobium sp.]|jgi:hypothetical protein|nr:hypothetical protein [Rhizomicrobium sp.]